MKQYNKLSTEDKINLYNNEYQDKGLSIAEIAKEYGTYPNRIRRDFIKLGLDIKSKSDVYKSLYEREVIKCPTIGRERTEEEKIKMSAGIQKAWSNMPKEKRDSIVKGHKKRWKEKSDNEKQEFINVGLSAIRETQKDGSKLEKYIFNLLTDNDYFCQRHVQYAIGNSKMHFDLFLPKIGVVIEIDGPSHFQDIWGEDKLEKTQAADKEKDRMVIGLGFKIIRIRHEDKLYQHHLRNINRKLLQILSNLEQKNKYIIEA